MLLIVTALLFLGLCVYYTVLFIRDLRNGEGSLLRKTGRWVRNLVDSLFGLG